MPRDEAPDVESSSDDYAARFAGPVGRFFLDVQSSAILELLERCDGHHVLEVGGGHGQLVTPLVRAGYQVTVLGSDATCERRLARCVDADYEFLTGSLLKLPFTSRCFDIVIGIRLLAHVENWRGLLEEFCRVSRRSVLIDYPERRSANAWGSWLFPLKHAVEGNTRPYRCFSAPEIADGLHPCGYQLAAVRRQFLLPMALHRSLRSSTFSRATERLARRMGATTLWGSPAIALAQAIPQK